VVEVEAAVAAAAAAPASCVGGQPGLSTAARE